MKVERLCWLGVPTDAYEQTVALFRDVLGLHMEFEEPATTELSLPSGDRIQVFAPGHEYYDFFVEHAKGPVALFEVDDVDRARDELERAGIDVIGAVDEDSDWRWTHFRGPDGNLYELASRRSEAPL